MTVAITNVDESSCVLNAAFHSLLTITPPDGYHYCPIVQMRKLRFRKVDSFAQSCLVLLLKPMLLNSLHYSDPFALGISLLGERPQEDLGAGHQWKAQPHALLGPLAGACKQRAFAKCVHGCYLIRFHEIPTGSVRLLCPLERWGD